MRIRSTIGALVVICSVPCAAQTAASLAVNAGSATDVTGVGSSAITIAPAFTRGTTLSSATFGASATQFANHAWSAGINTAVNSRQSARAVSPSLAIAFTAATTSYDFSYANADLVPSVEAKAGVASFFGGMRLSGAGTSAKLAAPSPVGPLPGGSNTTTSQTAVTGLGGVRFTSVAGSGEVAAIGYRGEAGQVAGVSQIDHVIDASVANSIVVLGGSFGARNRASASATYGAATLGIALTKAAMLQLSAGSYPANPMFGTAAGRFVNAGVTMRIGSRAGALPQPSGVQAPAVGMTRVSLRANDARRVELAGDFNKWKPIVATRADNGVWYVDLQLPAGEYRYAFRIDGKEWRVPEGIAAVDDEFGGKSAWLTVSRPSSK